MKKFFNWLIKCLLVGIIIGLILSAFFDNIVLMCLISVIFSVFIWGSEELVHSYLISRFKSVATKKFLSIAMGISLLTAIIATIIAMLVIKITLGVSFFSKPTLTNIFFVFLITLTATTIIVSLNYMVNFYEETKKRIIEEKEAREMAIKAELKALKAQINPHFLFNALNTIATLIRIEPKKAEKTVEDLAEMYHYLLNISEKEFVTLQQELDFTDAYLRIEKTRFGEKLEVEKNVSPGIFDILIPGLIIQPLVENSIKHGISKSSEKGLIKINVKKEDKSTKIKIEDNGQKIPENKLSEILKRGTGLKNISERLEKIYGQKELLKIKNRDPKGVIVTINIPEKKD